MRIKSALFAIAGISSLILLNLNVNGVLSQSQDTKEVSSLIQQESFSTIERIHGNWSSAESEKEFSIANNRLYWNNEEFNINQIDHSVEGENEHYKLSIKNVNSYSFELELTWNSYFDQIVINNEIFYRKVDKDLANYIKDKLTTLEPVSPEQLDIVPEGTLNGYFEISSLKTDEEESIFHDIYLRICRDYPVIELLENENYRRYLKLSEEITSRSQWTFPLLNTAGPKQILIWYDEIQTETDNDMDNIIQKLLPKIEEAHKNYEKRRETTGKVYIDEYTWPPLTTEIEQQSNSFYPETQIDEEKISPFDANSAFSYIQQKEGFNDDLAVNNSIYRADGSLEIEIVSKKILLEGGSGVVDRYVIYPDGKYFSVFE